MFDENGKPRKSAVKKFKKMHQNWQKLAAAAAEEDSKEYQHKRINESITKKLQARGIDISRYAEALGNTDTESAAFDRVMDVYIDQVLQGGSRQQQAPARHSAQVHRESAPVHQKTDNSTWTKIEHPYTPGVKWNMGEKSKQAVKEKGLNDAVFDALIDDMIDGLAEK